MYNNYYQHCDVYGISATSGSNIFMESNYFEAVKRPIMSSLQGTDIKGSKGLSLVKMEVRSSHTAMSLLISQVASVILLTLTILQASMLMR